MKNWICLVLLLSGLVEQSMAQVKKPTSSVGHTIQVSLKPYQNTKIYIGTNYGNNKVLADSCVLNEKSEGVFKGAQKLTPGIYFLVNPKYNILFDFLVDEAQNFKIVADTNNLSNYSIVGSSENDLFKEYSVAVNKIGSELAAIENKFKTATTSADSSLYRTQYISKDKELKDQRTSFMKAHPKSMMSYLLNVMQRPDAPAIPVINGKADSLYPFYYVKNHFWDDVVFNDNRLIRTPFFEAKLDEYFKNYVARDADSIIEEVQYMLTVAKTGKEIYPFLLFKFTNKYISPEFMGQDKVFLHLYQNFFAKGDTVLLNEASKKSITERAYSMMANQLGLPAPALDINTIDDKPFSLYKTAAPYTFIAFWDPTCSHCKVEIPQLDSMYKASWKALGVQIVGVNINYKELPSWKKFIADNQINNWFHVYQTEAALNKEITNQKPTTIRQLYDVFKTPTFYLLDANKRIIAKNLTLNQFDDFLKSKAKK
jgi:thiol-disulfide isomerase/thioredoxin